MLASVLEESREIDNNATWNVERLNDACTYIRAAAAEMANRVEWVLTD